MSHAKESYHVRMYCVPANHDFCADLSVCLCPKTLMTYDLHSHSSPLPFCCMEKYNMESGGILKYCFKFVVIQRGNHRKMAVRLYLCIPSQKSRSPSAAQILSLQYEVVLTQYSVSTPFHPLLPGDIYADPYARYQHHLTNTERSITFWSAVGARRIKQSGRKKDLDVGLYVGDVMIYD